MSLTKRWMDEVLERGFGEAAGQICLAHISDGALRCRVPVTMDDEPCILCGRTEPEHGRFEHLAAAVVETIRFYYADAVDWLAYDNEDGYQGPTADTEEVVADICVGAFESDISEDLCSKLVGAIGQRDDWTSWGASGDPDILEWKWELFSRGVRETARFVFLGAGLTTGRSPAPRQIAGFLDELRESIADGRLGLVQRVAPGQRFFRGRLIENLADAREWRAKELGPPPRGKAAANRMSPAGISMFYGSGDALTAVAEIAGHGVAPMAAVAEFRSTRALTVLDLTATPESPGSPFDEAARKELLMLKFLNSFVEKVRRPVIPDGREHVEYAPTQVLTEYLRWTSRSPIDGIAFPSAVVDGGVNYVLFIGPEGVSDEERLVESHVLSLGGGHVSFFDVVRHYEARPHHTLAAFNPSFKTGS